MGRITEGPMGNIRGKVGNLVVSQWRKTTTVRGLSAPSDKPRTQSQLEQQARMATATKFMRTLKKLLPHSYIDHPEKMSAYNEAVRHLLKNAITGDYPDYTIQFNRALVSKGGLLNEANATATAGQDLVTVTWSFNPADELVSSNDKAILVVYCEALNKSLFTMNSAIRSAGTASLSVNRFKGEEVHTWLAFISADGKESSNSVYTGKVTVS
jgi:hypothetical protein